MTTGRLEPHGEDGSTQAAEERDESGAPRETDFLQLARDMYTHSTDYVTANLRAQWEKNLRMFQSRHPQGSKYESSEYALRSKLFRPKTRSAVRKSEAAVASAFFATADVVVVEANDDNDEQQQASAAVNKELLQHRLTKTIPWFLTLVGAWQDTRVIGFCCSKQFWEYEEREVGKELVQAVDDLGMPLIEDGVPVYEELPVMEVVKDRPAVALFPPENIRFDPAANWMNPIHDSPYLIALHPMFVTDVKRRMDAIDEKTGQPQWEYAEDDVIAKARPDISDSTRMARQNTRQDPQQDPRPLRDFDVVMVHENFARTDGEEKVWYTLGTEHQLTKAMPLEEVYFHKMRPYAMGISTIETHKAVPSSAVELTQHLQDAANEIVNQRLDNVRFAMNGRYFVRRGKDVDLASIRSNVPGSATLMNDPEKDVIVHRPPDVTSSAYQEQDRLNVDFDELAGHFSVGTVQTERSLNETVGGMNLMSDAVNSVQEFDIRIFAETWVEPVLRQLVLLEQAYETDETVLAIAGEKAQLYQRFGFDKVTDDLLAHELNITVNAGFGASDPTKRLQRFTAGTQTVVGALGPGIQMKLNPEEVIKEVYGILGYKDGSRFFNLGDDPKLALLQQQLDQMQQELQSKIGPAKIQAEQKMQAEQMNLQADMARFAQEMRMEAQRMAAEAKQERERLMVDMATKIEIAMLNAVAKGQAENNRLESGERMRDRDRDAENERAERDRQSSERLSAAERLAGAGGDDDMASDGTSQLGQVLAQALEGMNQTIQVSQQMMAQMVAENRRTMEAMMQERELVRDPATGRALGVRIKQAQQAAQQ
jgi:hypothetical protein